MFTPKGNYVAQIAFLGVTAMIVALLSDAAMPCSRDELESCSAGATYDWCRA